MKKVAIINYKLNNLHCVYQACVHVGFKPFFVSKRKEMKHYDAIIFPGVGSFPTAMKNLKKEKLDEELIKSVKKGCPIFGICLGMQLLFSESTEFEKTNGLNLIKGSVSKFEKKKVCVIPHMGWNKIKFKKKIKVFDNVIDNSYMYFVHSYYVKPKNKMGIISITNYNGKIFCSSFMDNNIFATQFHPEKSSNNGLQIYDNFKKII